MDKQLFKSQSPEERLQMLQDNCDAIEKQSYMKQFTHEEISLMKDRLSEVSIEMNDIDTEKKDAMEVFKLRSKPLKKEKVDLLGNIKRKAIDVTEDCFKFVDQDNQEVGYYNSVGDLVFSRPILPSEKQKTIFSIKSGTLDK
jgi:hypothetical protein